MPVGIISRNWIRSLGKGEDAEQKMTQADDSEINVDDSPETTESESKTVESEDGDSKPFRLGEKKRADEGEGEVEENSIDPAAEDEDDESEEHVVETEGEEDPLAPAYDLEHGHLLEDVDHAQAQKKPVTTEIQSAKEFFSTEILYRYDVLEPEIQKSMEGSYRIELKGFQGGVWTLTVGEDLDVVNRREDADTILSMQQTDFIQLVNGELNPQIAMLAQKVKVTGDIDKAIAVQYLLVPALD